ncbi:2-amino-4-hydroxy-6-hydroxymethyldihydropteridine diphosphokinase [Mesorhizobium sp. L-8-10]|uniref:2-amino-4-hydroxy-6- hydroxymethyldihydropteridine diphosphokinase n=1 Tax=Mesorhizobium sp. L-8-10 TaxID=2744523 RepID=UPI001925C3B3|nr:2-amino-4-hydroxy-6-hydroxymethyldihydropteridine diphosphokinase [Mesorhizobium sp. L-8-10]BCH35694.1 2-amino-4-hydroxy-6-hydroxymethyldihydropteridine diphosphokinase [Mesorhizobium sp. L-8-10]
MTRAALGLGGNIGDPRAAMSEALIALDKGPRIAVAAVSSLYRTPPWGRTNQPDFLNAVALVDTDLGARQLLDLCLDAERALKRVRGERWGPRTIDVDILTFGDETIAEEGLQVPHPHMQGRAFVMVPLAEIAPAMIVRGRPAGEWANALDGSAVDRLEEPAWWQGRR